MKPIDVIKKKIDNDLVKYRQCILCEILDIKFAKGVGPIVRARQLASEPPSVTPDRAAEAGLEAIGIFDNMYSVRETGKKKQNEDYVKQTGKEIAEREAEEDPVYKDPEVSILNETSTFTVFPVNGTHIRGSVDKLKEKYHIFVLTSFQDNPDYCPGFYVPKSMIDPFDADTVEDKAVELLVAKKDQ